MSSTFRSRWSNSGAQRLRGTLIVCIRAGSVDILIAADRILVVFRIWIVERTGCAFLVASGPLRLILRLALIAIVHALPSAKPVPRPTAA